MDIRLNRDRMTGRCKGYAFVAMSREEEVDEVRDASCGAEVWRWEGRTLCPRLSRV
jgi:hypothetical protein